MRDQVLLGGKYVSLFSQNFPRPTVPPDFHEVHPWLPFMTWPPWKHLGSSLIRQTRGAIHLVESSTGRNRIRQVTILPILTYVGGPASGRNRDSFSRREAQCCVAREGDVIT